MEKQLRANLLALATTMVDKSGLSLSTIGERAVGNWRFFEHIKTNSFMVDKYDRAVKWFDENFPAGAKWPRGVDRPTKAKA